MFANSDIARSYSMAKTKLFYVINFGIATYFGTLLLEKLVKSKFYTVCFDENLNKVVQKCQMDFSLRFWDKTATWLLHSISIQSFSVMRLPRTCSRNFRKL